MVRRLSITVALCVTVGLVLFALCWLGAWIPNEPPPAEYPVRGIDVSHHQREIRWELVKASGIHFAYIKATEGADFKDASFAENWSGSAAAAIAHGAYHFFILGTPGELQASNFIATVPTEPNALPPAIDLEISGFNRNHNQSDRKSVV